MPPIDGLDQIDDAWTNREVTTAKEIPDSMVILGGGVVGVEMSQAYGSLGAKVALVEGERKLLPREEWFACEQVQESLEGLGVDVRRGQNAERVSREDGGKVTVHLGDGSSVSGDVLLVALGRTPQTQQLGLEDLGFEAGKYVDVDAALRRAGPRLAVRDRRRQRQGALHAHGQVPGADRHGPRARAGHRGRARRRRAAVAARDLLRPAGRRRRPHVRDRRGGRASTSRSSRSTPPATRAARSTAATRPARAGS